MKSYGKLTAALISGWFILALSASALDLFKNDSARVGPAVAIAAVTPILIFSVWLIASEKFRQFAFSLNPRVLTYLQTWRVVGVVFVIMEAHGILPADICAARRIRRHRHWSDGVACGGDAGDFQAPRQLYPLADPGNRGSRGGDRASVRLPACLARRDPGWPP